MLNNFLRITDISKEEFLELTALAIKLKRKEIQSKILDGRNIGLYFEKQSTRTRISFEVGINQLGGSSLVLTKQDMQLSRGESVYDTAKVLERYIDAFVARVFSHSTIEQLGNYSKIPVINALSDLEHPCQILADFSTILEHKQRLHDLKIVYVGDGNNVSTSLMLASALLGCHFVAASPEEFSLSQSLVEEAKEIAAKTGAVIEITSDQNAAVHNADVLYTDTWISMGDSEEKRHKVNAFLPYQVNAQLVGKAKDDCIVMHCLPAHRGEEITDEVMDGAQSVIWDQAEHRLHAQKALFVRLFQ